MAGGAQKAVSTWSLAEAKAKLSEVIEKAAKEGPQRVTRNGRAAAVVVSAEEWDRLNPQRSIVDVLTDPSLRGLLTDEEVDTLFARDRSLDRPVPEL